MKRILILTATIIIAIAPFTFLEASNEDKSRKVASENVNQGIYCINGHKGSVISLLNTELMKDSLVISLRISDQRFGTAIINSPIMVGAPFFPSEEIESYAFPRTGDKRLICVAVKSGR